ncbi:MAG: EboA domain-containing protein [Planctomycetes bacterium]|nr:EboA domain-containing protein [Planctomycetota bacterium]
MSIPDLRALLGGAATTADAMLAEAKSDRSRLPVLFPSLPRRCGRDMVRGGRKKFGPATVDLDAFRQCDLVAAFLLLSLGTTEVEAMDLYAHGDIEERAMLLRALHFLPVGPLTVRLFGEVQRTNVVLHLEAALCDGDLFSRTVGQPGFDLGAANRLLLKFAFLDVPLRRCYDAERHANAELSRMLQDLATEREAAGRAVWRDTWRVIGRAPCPGTLARLVGGLEHGDDGVRLAAAEGLLAADRKDLAAFARERLPREPRETIQAVLRRLA